jgi:hypothetical protein
MGGLRFPCRFDWKLLRQREAAGLRANGVALADGVLKAGGRIETGRSWSTPPASGS